MIKDTFFSLPRFMNLCRKEMVESWRSNVLRMVLMYGVMAVVMVWNGYFKYRYHNTAYFIRHANADPAWEFILILYTGIDLFAYLSGCKRGDTSCQSGIFSGQRETVVFIQ